MQALHTAGARIRDRYPEYADRIDTYVEWCRRLLERLGSTAHLAEVGDILVGFAQLVAEANGTAKVPHIREKIAEMVIYATLVRGLLEAAVVRAERSPAGGIFPDELYTNAANIMVRWSSHA